MNNDPSRAVEVKRKHEKAWLAVRGVVAVGVGQGADTAPCIVVSVESDPERIRREIPAEVEGVPVEIRVSGPMRAL